MPRRRRCNGPCHQLYESMELTKMGKRWLCENCLNSLADEAAGAMPDPVAEAAPEGELPFAMPPPADPEEAAEEGVEAGEAAPQVVTMYATPGQGDGTPVTVKLADVPHRLMEGYGLLRADADRAGIEVGQGGAVRALLLNGETEWVPEDVPELGVDENAIIPGKQTGAEPVLPAPTIRADAPMPDLRDEDEKEREWHELPDVKAPGWPLKRGRISASALACFARCPEQFRRKYVLGQSDPSGAAAIVGIAAHKALNRNWLYKMANGEDAPLTLIEEGFDVAYERGVAKEEKHSGAVDWGTDGTKARRAMDMDQWRARGKQVVGNYMLLIAGGVWPRAAEQVFVVNVAGLAVPVVGFIDLVTDRAMVDVKFGKDKQRFIAPGWRLQALTYLLAHDLDMEWHSMNWKGEYHTPADADLVMRRTAEAYAIATDLVRSSVDGILAYADRFGVDQPWPGALTHTWACKTCSFEPTCWWWHRPFHGEGSGSLL